MEKIRNEKELQARYEKCGKCLEKKFKCEPGHIKDYNEGLFQWRNRFCKGRGHTVHG